MSRTYRKKWLPDKDSKSYNLVLKDHQREKSCRPGCNICGKGWLKKLLKKKARRNSKNHEAN